MRGEASLGREGTAPIVQHDRTQWCRCCLGGSPKIGLHQETKETPTLIDRSMTIATFESAIHNTQQPLSSDLH